MAELCTCLAVGAVLLALAAPSFIGLKRRASEASAYHLLTTALMEARVHAITHRTSVVMCPSTSGNRCTLESTWSLGWIAFPDADKDRQPTNGGEVFRQFEAIPGPIVMRSSAGRTFIRFMPDGRAAGSNLRIDLCFEDQARLAGSVVVNNAGRVRSERGAAGLPCPFRPE